MSPTYPHISQREGPENTTICASQIFEMLGLGLETSELLGCIHK